MWRQGTARFPLRAPEKVSHNSVFATGCSLYPKTLQERNEWSSRATDYCVHGWRSGAAKSKSLIHGDLSMPNRMGISRRARIPRSTLPHSRRRGLVPQPRAIPDPSERVARFPSTWPFGNQGVRPDIVADHPSMSALAMKHSLRTDLQVLCLLAIQCSGGRPS